MTWRNALLNLNSTGACTVHTFRDNPVRLPLLSCLTTGLPDDLPDGTPRQRFPLRLNQWCTSASTCSGMSCTAKTVPSSELQRCRPRHPRRHPTRCRSSTGTHPFRGSCFHRPWRCGWHRSDRSVCPSCRRSHRLDREQIPPSGSCWTTCHRWSTVGRRSCSRFLPRHPSRRYGNS